MGSLAHGRNYLIGHGNPNGAPKRTSARFSVTAPDGSKRFKDVVNGHGIKDPVALFYKHGERWITQTVVDRGNMPDWARNYTEGPAKRA